MHHLMIMVIQPSTYWQVWVKTRALAARQRTNPALQPATPQRLA